MAAFGVVKLQSSANRVEHTGRDASQGAAFELGVVLDTHARKGGDLAAAQSRHSALSGLGDAGLLRGDLCAP
jgi:hypothetical protein